MFGSPFDWFGGVGFSVNLKFWKRRSGRVLSSTLLLLDNCISRDYSLYPVEDIAFGFLYGQDTVSAGQEGMNNAHERKF